MQRDGSSGTALHWSFTVEGPAQIAWSIYYAWWRKLMVPTVPHAASAHAGVRSPAPCRMMLKAASWGSVMQLGRAPPMVPRPSEPSRPRGRAAREGPQQPSSLCEPERLPSTDPAWPSMMCFDVE